MTSFEEQAALVYDDGFCPDGGYIDRAIVDQWWAITVACDHGQWRGVSNGPIDLGQGLARAIANARRAHEGLGPCPVLSPERRACEFTEGHDGKHHAYAPTGGAPIESWADPPKGLIATQAVQTRAGWHGQVIADGMIVAESDPISDDSNDDSNDERPSDLAIRWANDHVVNVFRQLLSAP